MTKRREKMPPEPSQDDSAGKKEELRNLFGVDASSDQFLALAKHVRAGATLEVALAASGVSLEDAQRPLVASMIAKAEAEYEATLQRVVTAAAAKDWHAAAFILERRFPEHWGRSQAEHRGLAAARFRVAVPLRAPTAPAPTATADGWEDDPWADIAPPATEGSE